MYVSPCVGGQPKRINVGGTISPAVVGARRTLPGCAILWGIAHPGVSSGSTGVETNPVRLGVHQARRCGRIERLSIVLATLVQS